MKGITSKPFGTARSGEKVLQFTLENVNGAKAHILTYGATVRSIEVPDPFGELVDVCLGYRTLEEYEKNGGYLGASLGRYANRICRGEFTLSGTNYKLFCNDGDNHLHGGKRGYSHRVWEHSVKGDTLTLRLVSPDGEEGYPGTVTVDAAFKLDDTNALEIAYRATTDRVTPINLSNHTYFNLDGDVSGDILSHLLCLKADSYLPIDSMIPTGEIRGVLGTPFDFTAPKEIGRDIDLLDEQLVAGGGYDHNFVINGSGYRECAFAKGKKSGITMTVLTNTPGVQLYTGNFLSGSQVSKSDWPYRRRSGFCLETQQFPDAMNHDNFPSPILRPGEEYCAITTYRFGKK